MPKRQWESFHCEVVRGPDYGTRWHFHPEYQLTLALKSSGHRVVGDNIGALADGDIVLIGANLPHVWHQDPGAKGRTVDAIIVRFDDSFLGREFFALPEVEPVRQLLQRAARGLEVRGATRAVVTEHMQRLAQSEGLSRIIELLAVLNALASSDELKTLASASYEPQLESADQGRMERVVDFIHNHLTDEIDRQRLAKLAHLSLGAFSRFFHSRTGKTVPEYVNEVRIGRACRMLAEDAGNITDIAMDCGYRNLANFNRRFREVVGTTPSAYRQKFRGVAGR
ncbi:MAG: AraC family transcriptional regulator [Caldilinea sp.]|nr:AraC family transcriptional regulator [Caldilinea sp.]